MARFGLIILASFLLSACASTGGGVSDRYAFWRDDAPNSSAGAKPNLGDVPAAPNVKDAQADMNSMRQRLETDRDNAYKAAAGYPVVENPPVTSSDIAYEPPAVVNQNELAPAYPNNTSAIMPQYETPVPNLPQAAYGDVQYNYAPGQNDNYVYGNSAVQYSMYQQEAQQLMQVNSSVSIDFSALEGQAGEAGAISPVGLSGQGEPLVYFKHGSARLGSGDRKRLRELATLLKQQPASVVVVGHASKRTGVKDPLVSREANLKMSAKRASVVLRELARQGVSAEKVHVTAMGDSTAMGKSTETQDRRVDILFDQ